MLLANPLNQYPLHIYLYLFKFSADRSGSVREGDVVIAVNYTDTTFSTVEEVVSQVINWQSSTFS